MQREGGRSFPGDRQRSVFIGNISYDVTEDQIREVFSKAGTLNHLRIMHDRDTGKPKGYGFAEFSDVKSAELAIRNLNGHELNGRALRVDSAAGFQNRAQGDGENNVIVVPPEESPYGKECDPKDAPEVISRSVASLPPEKMYHLMKQMKEIVISNPSEAKSMLLQNPQLSYALLQASVVMRLIEPQTAMAMLHREQPLPVGGPFHAPPSASQAQSSSQFGGQQSGGYTMPPSYGGPPTSHAPPSSQPNYGAPPPGYGRGPPQAPAAQPPPPAAANDVDIELLHQVMNLTEEQLAQLPLEEREQVRVLRERLLNA